MCAVAIAAHSAPAQGIARGVVVPNVVSLADTAERYALYVPTRYDTARRWPILIVMDPRGRAVRAIGHFTAAAERDGYVVVSSYNTVSDSTEEPNVRALNAIFADLPRLFAVDGRRLYLAGFSGTARLAWGYAYQAPGHIAGILAFGAGLPWNGMTAALQLRQQASFVWFGGAGTEDFNYDGVRVLAAELDSLAKIPHRVEYYPGPHAWAPESVCGDGLDWMELQAMRSGLEARNDSLIARWYASRLDAARALENAGDVYDAYTAYVSMRNDFASLTDVGGAKARITALEKMPRLRTDIAHREALTAAYDAYRSDTLTPFLTTFDKEKRHPPPLERSLSALDIAPLLARSRSAADSLDAGEARRALASTYVNTVFYAPRKYLAANDPRRALALVEIADAIQPGGVDVCFEKAVAYARLAQPDSALTSLRCAAATGHLTRHEVEQEAAFGTLRSDTSYTNLIASLNDPPER